MYVKTSVKKKKCYLAVAYPVLFAICISLSGCQPVVEVASESVPAAKLETKHVPNAVRLHEKVISGGLPEDKNAFQELKQLGVKTIVCVDGAKPDTEMASQFGMQYVHLPHGYDGISQKRAQELAKAVRDLDGPIFIHCHHGKHRSPAAASVACVGAGLIPSSAALTVLQLAGTSKEYRGLYRSAREAKRIDSDLLNALQVEFHPIEEIPPMADAMVEMEKPYHHLQQFSKNQWTLLGQHPDILPTHEALMLREHYTELLRTDETKSYPREFAEWLNHSMDATKEIEALLRNQRDRLQNDLPVAGGNQELSNDTVERLDRALNLISEDCRKCHRIYRN
jgi:protein tyrosine phosphatase (PTP) superfamily phosphohydrolase (DUF442 family)